MAEREASESGKHWDDFQAEIRALRRDMTAHLSAFEAVTSSDVEDPFTIVTGAIGHKPDMFYPSIARVGRADLQRSVRNDLLTVLYKLDVLERKVAEEKRSKISDPDRVGETSEEFDGLAALDQMIENADEKLTDIRSYLAKSTLLANSRLQPK